MAKSKAQFRAERARHAQGGSLGGKRKSLGSGSGGPTLRNTPNRTPSKPSKPNLPYSGGTSFGGGGGGGGYAAPAPAPVAPPPPPPPSKEDWLAGDSLFQAQKAALERALKDYVAGQTADVTKYNTDFGDALKSLGWLLGDQKIDGTDPFNTEGGSWSETDLNTASGRSLSNQMNDFASRGMLQSSGYAGARDDLMRSLNDQRESLVSGRGDYLADLARQKAKYQNESTLNQQQAKLESLARRTAQFSL